MFRIYNFSLQGLSIQTTSLPNFNSPKSSLAPKYNKELDPPFLYLEIASASEAEYSL